MTLYITINRVSLETKPPHKICLLIQSNSATLQTSVVSRTKQPSWPDSLICSTRQQFLNFNIVDPETTNNFATGMIHFSTTKRIWDFPDQVVGIKVKLRDERQASVGFIQLMVEYDKSRNYLGEIEFFAIETLNGKDYARIGEGKLKSLNSRDDHVLLYKGPCKSKNIFSCMDQSTDSDKFTFVQEKYR